MRRPSAPSVAHACRPFLLLLTTLLPLCTAPAQEASLYQRTRRLIQEYEAIEPPPPPVERVELGTLDAATGGWTWGPNIERKETGEENPAFAPVFDALRLPPMYVELSPNVRVTGLPANVPMAAPRFRPGPGGDRRAGGVGRVGGVAVEALPTAYTGGSLGKWKYYTAVRAGKVDLLVRVINRPVGARLSVTCEGRTAEADASEIDILVPPRVAAPFTVQCGAQRFEDKIWFDRPPILGFFQLEALPIAVVYEPPGSGSSQTYTVSDQIGTTLRAFGSTTDSDAEPVPTTFSQVSDFMGMVGGAGKIVEQFYPQVGAAMKGAKEGFDKLFGKQERTSTVEHTVTEEHALSIRITKTASVTTRSGLGPGRGDMIWYLYHPVFAWLCAQDEDTGRVFLAVSLLTFQRCSAHSAEALRSGVVPEPDAEMRRLLLAHDVLSPEHAAEPGILLSRARAGSFLGGSLRRLVPADLPEQEIPAGGELRLIVERTRTAEDTSIETTTKTVTTSESRGILGYLAKGLPQEGTRSMTVTMGAASAGSVSSTVRVEVTLGGRVDETQLLRCWYDRRSGTFAYEPVAYGGAPSALANPTAIPVQARPRPAGRSIAGTVSRTGQQPEGKQGSAATWSPELGEVGPPFVLRTVEGLARRMGRLAVEFPAAAPAAGTRVEVLDAAGVTAQDSHYGSWRVDLLPGDYTVKVGGRAVPGVRVAAGQETVLRVGTLRVNAGPGTKVEILAAEPVGRPAEPVGRPAAGSGNPAGEQVLVSGYGTVEAGLPAGHYRVRIRGRSEAVTVTAGEVTEF